MFKDDFIPTNENSTFRNSNIAYNYKFFKGNPLNNTVKISCKKPLSIVKSRTASCVTSGQVLLPVKYGPYKNRSISVNF